MHERISYRRAIEALRAGVPSREVVRNLGTNQVEIMARFACALGWCSSETVDSNLKRGFWIEGEFGSGKSHVLEALEAEALQNNYACSRIVVSKETLLGDPRLLYRAAMEGLRLPDRMGRGLHEVALRIDHRSTPYAAFYRELQVGKFRLPEVFAGTVFLHEAISAEDVELAEKLVDFWEGQRINLTDLRHYLKKQGGDFALERIPEGQLARLRFGFASRLIRAAGYAGWVILLDECELIARFPFTMRAKSYSMLHYLLADTALSHDRILLVATFTEEFTGEIFHIKDDERRIKQRWPSKSADLRQSALRGLDILKPESGLWYKISLPTESDLDGMSKRIALMYERAYELETMSPEPTTMTHSGTESVRVLVRKLITVLDFARFDSSYHPEIESICLRPNLSGEDAIDMADEVPEDVALRGV